MKKEANKKPNSSKMINKLIETLMVKTGIKSGPEFTADP